MSAMIRNLLGECGFPPDVEVSATPLIDGSIALSVYKPQVVAIGGVGSTQGARVGRVVMDPIDAIKLIKSLSEALEIVTER